MRKNGCGKQGAGRKELPGVTLEKLAAQIQQMMDVNSAVIHNEWLEDRTGNKRQYDVVIRGHFAGRPILGVMECKDHRRKKGPDAIEAFAKKCENLGANIRIIVSKKGFTLQALKLAKHEHIGCISLLPEDPSQAGFSIGETWYAELSSWDRIELVVHFDLPASPLATFRTESIQWGGKPVAKWFLRELILNHSNEIHEGDHYIELTFDQTRNFEIEGQEYPVKAMTCIANRVHRIKKKWVSWSGDAFYDWHMRQLTIPAGGILASSPVETDLSKWPDFDGDIPQDNPAFIRAVLRKVQIWDENENGQVPDLSAL